VHPAKRPLGKKCEIQGGSQEMAALDGRLMAKILITTVQR